MKGHDVHFAVFHGRHFIGSVLIDSRFHFPAGHFGEIGLEFFPRNRLDVQVRVCAVRDDDRVRIEELGRISGWVG